MFGYRFRKRTALLAVTAAVIAAALSGCLPGQNSTSAPEASVTAYTSEEVFKALEASLSEYSDRTVFAARLEQDTIDRAVLEIRHAHPEYFWINGYSTTMSGSETTVEFMTLNDYMPEQLREMHGELMSAVNDIISQVPTSLGEYEQALFVHDYIVNNTSYATDKVSLSYNGLWGNAYGCLVDGSAVCQGYSEAYSLILQKLGIECGVCTGQSIRGRHAWNYVKMYGDYYWVDVTWDDPESEDGSTLDKLCHNYFMINDELLLRTRSLDDGQYLIPSCTSMDRNYFVMKNAYLTDYNTDEIGRILAESADTRLAEIMFRDKAGFDKAIDSLFGNEEIWELSDYADLGYDLNYVYDDKMYILEISY